MGAYSMDGLLSPDLRRRILDQVILPTVDGMNREGRPFAGILYAGLMLTEDGPRVLEYNVRFGDPEAQVILPRLRSDLATLLLQAARGDLASTQAEWTSRSRGLCGRRGQGVPGVLSQGTGDLGTGEDGPDGEPGGVPCRNFPGPDGRFVTSGGRVLGVTALAPSLDEAVRRAYSGLKEIHFDGIYYRRDIAYRRLSQTERNS